MLRRGPGGGGGTGRYVGMTGKWTDPMRTVRSKERAQGIKCEKETVPGEKETVPSGKATNVAEK